MHWKFEEMLSVSVLHQRYVERPPVDPGGYQPEFALAPSPETRQRFQRLGWLSKSMANGILVFAEKTVRQDGTEFIKGSPEPLEFFTFYLKLNQPSLLNETRPFANPPKYSGRSRLLYFDNLNPTLIGPPNGPQLIRLTAETYVGLPEFGSRGLTPFRFATSASTVTNVTATAISPAVPPASESFNVKEGARTVELDLPEDAWRVKEEPAGEPEILYLSQKPLPPDVFGLIRIYNTEALPLNQYRRFQALFARA